SKDYEFIGRLNGTQTTLIGVFLLPGANALKVADDVVKTVDEIKGRFPPGLVYSVPYDTTKFVRVSIREVLITLGEAMLLVLVVCSVFVPIAFLGGLAGELYRQFAVTIAIAVVISGVVALTLTPSLCVLILKREHKLPGGFFNWFNAGFLKTTKRYTDGVGWMIRRAAVGVVLFGGMVALATFLWRITPGSLVPDEDQGFYIAAVILPDGATLERTDQVVAKVLEAIRSNPNNED